MQLPANQSLSLTPVVCLRIDLSPGGRLVSVIAEHAEAVRDRDAAGFSAAAKRFEEPGALLSATDAAAQAARSQRGRR